MRPASSSPAQDHVLQGRPADQPHREEEAVLGLAGLVDGDDVRVVDRGLEQALAAEALAERRRPRLSSAARTLSATVRFSESWVAS